MLDKPDDSVDCALNIWVITEEFSEVWESFFCAWAQ
jgi:hypothetical protein